jgi:ribonuclease R
MHTLGDVVDVRLVEAAPVAGALRFELLSEGSVPRSARRRESRGDGSAGIGRHPGSKSAKGPGKVSTKPARPPKKVKLGRNARLKAKAAKGNAGSSHAGAPTAGKPKKKGKS